MEAKPGGAHSTPEPPMVTHMHFFPEIEKVGTFSSQLRPINTFSDSALLRDSVRVSFCLVFKLLIHVTTNSSLSYIMVLQLLFFSNVMSFFVYALSSICISSHFYYEDSSHRSRLRSKAVLFQKGLLGHQFPNPN